MKQLIVTGLILAASVTSAWAQPAHGAAIDVKNPWVRATVAQQKATGAFMQLTAKADTRLVAAQSPVAGVVEIHEMAMDHNVMKMRALPAGLALPAGQTVELKPGGYHVMLLDLKGQVKEGDTVPLTAEAGLLQRPEDLPELRGMVVLVSRITLWLSLGVIATLMLIGPWLIPFWTRGTIPFAPWLFLFLLLATLGEAVWRALSAPRLGSNRHRPLVWGGLALSLSGLALAWFLTGILGLEGAGLAAATVEAGMGLLVAATTLPLLGLSWQGYVAALLRPPVAEVCRTGAAIVKRIRP